MCVGVEGCSVCRCRALQGMGRRLVGCVPNACSVYVGVEGL